MGRKLGGHNRSPEQILKDEVKVLKQQIKNLRADYLKDQRIFTHKLSTQQNIIRMHGAGIGKIINHLKGRGLWLVGR